MSVVPWFIGQVYKDTNTGNIWRANSLTPGDWTLEVQNMKIQWTPRSSDQSKLIGPNLGNDSGLVTLSLDATEINYYLVVSGESNLLSVSIPNCTSALDISIDFNPILQSISAPNLATISDQGGGFCSQTMPSLPFRFHY